MHTDSVKQAVVDTYGKLAKSSQQGLVAKLFGCCNGREAANQVGAIIGYSFEELNTAPQGSNLGVGCGNPFALAKINEGETVVDLGSGAGFDAFLSAREVGPSGRVIGIDLSEDMLDLARINAEKGPYSHVEFIKGDIEDLPLDDELADHIISNCVINLSLKKGEVYREAYRVLKKGGELSVSDIVLEKELPEWIQNSLAGHIACVSGAEKLATYIQYIKDAGFENIVVESKSDFPLELMLTDPKVIEIAEEMNLHMDTSETREIASRVLSVSISAVKR